SGLNIEWLYDAIQYGYQQVHSGTNTVLDRDCSAIANGGPDTVSIEKLTVDDVETVEIYDTQAPSRPTLRRPISRTPMNNADHVGPATRGKQATLVSVWLR